MDARRIDYGELAGATALPPLGDSARRLFALSEDDRDDLRVLGLIAQREPVHLARLLALANASARGQSRPAFTAEEAIRVIGTRTAYAAMVAVALATSFPVGRDSAGVRQWLLRHSVNLAITARRVASFLFLREEISASLLMAALFDPLGVHAFLLSEHPQRDDLLAALRDCSNAGPAWPRELDVLDGYWFLSAALARHWGADPAVSDAIVGYRNWGETAPATDCASLLWLCHELLALRLSDVNDVERLLGQPNPLGPGVRARLASERSLELAFADA